MKPQKEQLQDVGPYVVRIALDARGVQLSVRVDPQKDTTYADGLLLNAGDDQVFYYEPATEKLIVGRHEFNHEQLRVVHVDVHHLQALSKKFMSGIPLSEAELKYLGEMTLHINKAEPPKKELKLHLEGRSNA